MYIILHKGNIDGHAIYAAPALVSIMGFRKCVLIELE